jgi:hypothetical protein
MKTMKLGEVEQRKKTIVAASGVHCLHWDQWGVFTSVKGSDIYVNWRDFARMQIQKQPFFK